MADLEPLLRVLGQGRAHGVVAHDVRHDPLIRGRERPVVRGAREEVRPKLDALRRPHGLGHFDRHPGLRPCAQLAGGSDLQVIVEDRGHAIEQPFAVLVHLISGFEHAKDRPGVGSHAGRGEGWGTILERSRPIKLNAPRQLHDALRASPAPVVGTSGHGIHAARSSRRRPPTPPPVHVPVTTPAQQLDIGAALPPLALSAEERLAPRHLARRPPLPLRTAPGGP